MLKIVSKIDNQIFLLETKLLYCLLLFIFAKNIKLYFYD